MEENRFKSFPFLQDDFLAQELANAIVLQATKDYRTSYKNWNNKNKTKRNEARKFRREVPKFFRSAWYRTLTTLDGEQLLKNLKEECK